MKKKVLFVGGILLTFIFIVGIMAKYEDSARVRNGIEPKYVLKVVSYDGKKVTYWGLGYKVIRYPSISPNEPYNHNIGVKFGSWLMRYKLSQTEKEEHYNIQVEVLKQDIQDELKFSTYLERDGRIIYLSNKIKEVYLIIDDRKITLNDYISKSWQTTDDAMKHLIEITDNTETLKDGGTKINKSLKYNITIIKCHTITGSRDYYIGDSNMLFDNNLMCN